MRYIFFLFVAIPIIEIALLIQVGSFIGVWMTIAIVILTAALGSWLLRQQGVATMASARARLNSGQMPAQEMLEGMILLVGGVLLLTPGFFTDAVGFLCLIPPTRRMLAARLARSAMVMQMGPAGPAAAGPSAAGPGAAGSAHRASARPAPGRNSSGDILEGEYRRED